jgi:3-hydroxyacyl-[acyl-carrier-protein] dehydratase
MLLDNFYTILSSESSDSTTWTIQIELNPDHTVYQGHFPEHPVVPGVCLLQLIKEWAQSETLGDCVKILIFAS